MKFKLKPLNQRFSDEELLSDLIRVSKLVGSPTVTKSTYDEHGRHSRGTLSKRFGSWAVALERAGLTPLQPTTNADLIADLQRVANELGRNYISFKEYRRLGRWSERPFVRVFGDWRRALEAAGLGRHPNLKDRVSDVALFENIEATWIALGRQPSYSEMEKPLSKFSSSTYANRFGGWRAALEAFVKWINEESHPEETEAMHAVEKLLSPLPQSTVPVAVRVRRTSRAVNLRLRFLVLQRDNFTCRFCGRSPALHPGLVLHVDHIVPWEKGGETILENLQALCEPCNLGKGNVHEPRPN